MNENTQSDREREARRNKYEASIEYFTLYRNTRVHHTPLYMCIVYRGRLT